MTTTIANLIDEIKKLKQSKQRHRSLAQWGNVESKEIIKHLNCRIRNLTSLAKSAADAGLNASTPFEYEWQLFSTPQIINL